MYYALNNGFTSNRISYKKALKHDDLLRIFSVFFAAVFAGFLILLHCSGKVENSWLLVSVESSSIPEVLILLLLLFFVFTCYSVKYFCPPVWSPLLGVSGIFAFYNLQMDCTWSRWLIFMVLDFAYCFSYFKSADQPRRSKITDRLQQIAFLLIGLCLAMGLVKLMDLRSEKLDKNMKEAESVQIEAYTEYYNQFTLESQADALRWNDWETLSVSERVAVCKRMLNIEVNRLKLASPLFLSFETMDSTCSGYYSNDTRTVHIKAELIYNSDSPDELAYVLFHEAFHAYEHDLVSLLTECPDEYTNLALFDTAKTYQIELENYVTSDEDYWTYQNQAVEQDANSHAERELQAFKTAIS